MVALSSGAILAQPNSVVCGLTAVAPVVRSEGLAERLGDVVLTCTGPPGQSVTGNLTLALNTAITNRVTNGKLDVALTADTGTGRTLIAQPSLLGVNQIVFAGITFAVGQMGRVELRISNLRGDATQGSFGLSTIQATLAFNPPSVLTLSGNLAVVGVPQRGLFSTTLLGTVSSHLGSPLPEELGFLSLLETGTRFSSTRITEGFAGAFETGTRIMLRFTGYPANARLFTPSVIIGANGLQPTAAGDFGGTVSGGRYGAGGLALVRIAGAGANGAGGYPAASVGSVSSAFDAVSEVPLSGGTGVAVYEVIDSNPVAIETAQIPIFIGLPRSIEGYTLTTATEVFFGPISPDAVPRFKPVSPGADCTTQSDCSTYVPKLEAYPQHTDFIAVSGANFQIKWIPFENVGGGIMAWSARVEYKSGSGWMRISPTSGLQGNMIRLDIIPMGLAVGKYEGTLVIDAGAAGVARYPVTLEVKPLPVPTPVISSIGGAATVTGPISRGGLATIKGANLGGTNVSVTFDGRPARILYTSADQLNVEVPSDLVGATAALVVTSNGVQSASRTVDLALVAPGIFPNGILNQDNRVNSPETPAASPSIIQIFATGLLPVQGNAQVEVRLGDQLYSGAALPYAGQAPGLPGVQQVNFMIPAGLSTSSPDLAVCATPSNGVRTCSPATRLHVR
ncbi:MAG TPA: IPT/TIG domain-containing protein [Bryobacteraceae bacterium]|nr:IPT/TIG domain-containing protein [Bryobacteraceae bacterium]